MSRPASRNTDRPSSHSHSRSASRRSSTHQLHSASHSNQPDPLAFCNAFWGDSGYDALQSKTRQSSKMLEDLRTWYKERAAIEDDYAKRLAKLTKSPLLDGASETELGGMRKALEVIRDTTRQSAHSHAELAGTVRTALERKVADFVVRRDGLRKNVSLSCVCTLDSDVSHDQTSDLTIVDSITAPGIDRPTTQEEDGVNGGHRKGQGLLHSSFTPHFTHSTHQIKTWPVVQKEVRSRCDCCQRVICTNSFGTRS